MLIMGFNLLIRAYKQDLMKKKEKKKYPICTQTLWTGTKKEKKSPSEFQNILCFLFTVIPGLKPWGDVPLPCPMVLAAGLGFGRGDATLREEIIHKTRWEKWQFHG